MEASEDMFTRSVSPEQVGRAPVLRSVAFCAVWSGSCAAWCQGVALMFGVKCAVWLLPVMCVLGVWAPLQRGPPDSGSSSSTGRCATRAGPLCAG